MNRCDDRIPIIKDNEKEDLCLESVRTFNQIEMERLQTVPENYTSILDVNKASDLLGDGWTVDVISHILNYINK